MQGTKQTFKKEVNYLHILLHEQVCGHFKSIVAGGGQNRKKDTNSGRPSGITPSMGITLMQDTAPPSFFSDTVHIPDYNQSINTQHIECAICKGVPQRPLELLCDNIVCLQCCCNSVQSSCTLTCPCCKSTTLCDESSNHFQRPSKVTMSVLGNMLVNCSRGCNRSVKVVEFQQHLESACKQHFDHTILSPSHVTAKDILNKPSQTPTTPMKRRVAATVIRRLMSEQADSSVIKIPTQGRVSIIYRL